MNACQFGHARQRGYGYLRSLYGFFEERPSEESVLGRVCIKSLLLMAMAISSGLAGCNNRQAPSPTNNPQAHITKDLKITVDSSDVNRIGIQSMWVVSNLSCAPTIYPAGNKRVKQVMVSEAVEKVGESYIAKISVDRFVSDKCQWANGGVVVNFYRNDYLLSTAGVNTDVLRGERVERMTCLTSPRMKIPVCGQRSNEALYKSEDKGAFNVTMELIK